MELEKGVLVVLTKMIQESVGTSAYKNDCVRWSHSLFGGVGYPRRKIPLWCVDTFGRLTSLQDVIVIFALPKRARWLQVRIAGVAYHVFSLLILLLDAKVRVNGTKQRAHLMDALQLDENFLSFSAVPFP